ncbi:hypothetical protein M441DRAFT_131140 [Trichoderma asperellum CBS 433.97]|uniref:Uncharacterized protein n=2 Tax=Trichoderma asperellum TaxID=101201 RepID=A0A2T3ZL33_TRIA4|nr:hypothetical protein M441DRAFT_131140 [Trichoderma asperellum CBS 433.97]PTB45506.1 hypothetical protein M441DRAFT_131140 [Trichoderma asperellum CBS 433.97]
MFAGDEYSYENSYRRACGKDEVFCKNPYCITCRNKDESITVHADCFHLFVQRCVVKNVADGPARKKEIYRRLWLAGRKRYAWRGIISKIKFMSSTTLESPPPETISEICGFRDVFLPEVALLIQSHSRSHILWRYCSVLKLVRDLELAESLETATYPLRKVLSWSRGELPKLVQDKNLAGPFILLTLDARGVKSIERIPEVPTTTGTEIPTPSFLFALATVERLSGAKIEFELGMCHFHVGLHDFGIRSSPAISNKHNDLWRLSLSSTNSVSLDPNCCTGLSFFLRNHHIVDIHAHSTRHPPTHVEKFKYMEAMFASARDDGIEWIYMPLTAQDVITAIRARKHVLPKTPCYFTFYTKSGDKIVVGTPYKERGEHTTKSLEEDTVYIQEKDARQHFNLIYQIRPSFMPSAIYPDTDTVADGDADSQYPVPVIDPPPTITSLSPYGLNPPPPPKAFFSSASLEGILDVHVFTVGWKKLCKGILVEYENGSKRALGQCRLGLDEVQSWHKPLSMHYMPEDYERNVCDLIRETRTSKSAVVTFDSESSHRSEDGSMEENYYELKGRLNFWFTFHAIELQFVDG